MEADAALHALAAWYGISTEYVDIRGKRFPTSDASIRTLLAAMSLPTANTDAATLLEWHNDNIWQQRLPPVLVVNSSEVIHIRIHIPASHLGLRYVWSVRLENGEKNIGEFTPATEINQDSRTVDGINFIRCDLVLPGLEITGYHTLDLALAGVNETASMPLIVTPHSCYQPPALQNEGRVWGTGVQLYGVRSRRNWGIGDFTDLRHLVENTADAGGGIVGVNPLHALFQDNPAHISPYSPSSRCALNVLYIDVENIPEFHECATVQSLVSAASFQARLRRLRAEKLLDYPEVALTKYEILKPVFQHFCSQHLQKNTDRGNQFIHFRATCGGAIESQARFEALQAHFHAQDASIWGWPVWPESYRDPDSIAVHDFVARHAEAVDFYIWLQWLADAQLAEAGHRSWQRKLGVGLYFDLAVGVNPGGAEAWRWQKVLAANTYIGAPPDDFNPEGQNWGLPPYAPHRLREAAYAPLIEVLRANMRHAGALRIDHAMGLARLFWVPADQTAQDGAYVTYPLQDMLGIVALESQRNTCLVIGEDLGTVPEDFRPQLAQKGLLSFHPFLFEREEDDTFTAPANFPRQALVCASTHDLPTLAGLWKGVDIDTRAALDLLGTASQRNSTLITRAQDRARLLMALDREQLLPDGASIHPVALPELTLPFVMAIHSYLARTPSQIFIVQPEDMLGMEEQANLPASLDHQHPNWRRRLTLDLEEWPRDERFIALGALLRLERGSAAMPVQEMPKIPRTAIIPRATYRLQFNRNFTFFQATALIPYLAELGISHCYASPYLKARPGSGHGYDIVDHATLNPEIGTAEDYERFVATLHEHGMGQILDTVPNHMGIMGADNDWWMDVLENGPASSHGQVFDIDWDPLNPDLKGKVLLPLLGDHYGAVLNKGELKLEFDEAHGEFNLFYYQHRLPIDPATYPQIINLQIERLIAILGEHDNRLIELQSLLTAFSRLPSRLIAEAERQIERQRDKEIHKRHLAALYAACADIADHISNNLLEINGQPNKADSFDSLHELIQMQGYRLAYWRVASEEINYRRFFDINDLAALRMEEPAVFADTHRLIFKLIAEGKIDGLRIDHPDGLYDPGRYFSDLQEYAAGKTLLPGEPLPIYLLIEKILAEHERLPENWPIHGATGYRFANLANALFVDSRAELRFTRIYRDFIKEDVNFDELVYQCKKLIMDTALASELNMLAHRLWRIAASSRDTCDFTLNSLHAAIAEIVACFPVYRTYVNPSGISADDLRHIEWAVAVSKKRSQAADISIFDFIQKVLTAKIAQDRSEEFQATVLAFTMKFQQFTSPVMAKGLEDTSCYRYHRLVTLNDVGGDPRRFGVSVAAYHAATRSRAERLPHNLLATSTHDSKRAEDVRARINVLSEMPAAWKLMLKRWSRINRARKSKIDGLPAPSANDEYLLYQTLIGTWPQENSPGFDIEVYRQRIEAYMVKAVREAKEHSSWINVNTAYESALTDFIARLLEPTDKNRFLADFIPAVHRVAYLGYINSLAITVLKLTAPGVPDLYQGSELWQFHLVDPDNRHPVDFLQRQNMLNEIKRRVAEQNRAELLDDLLSHISDGRIKLFLTWKILQLRKNWCDVFKSGCYQPLAIHGFWSEHICAFMRKHDSKRVIIAVPRLLFNLSEDPASSTPASWQDTALAIPETENGSEWFDIFSGEKYTAGAQSSIPAQALFKNFPLAVLSNCRDMIY